MYIKYLKIRNRVKRRIKWLLFIICNKKLVSYNWYLSVQPRLEDILGKILSLKSEKKH